jgi:predicted MPP superfamily phosphohydrolase
VTGDCFVILLNEPAARPSPAPTPAAPAGAAHPAKSPPRPDPTLPTAWAVHPCPIFDLKPKPGPWFQFRVPYGFEWNCCRLPVPNLPPPLEGLRILHVSDFHLRRFWKEPYDELLAGIAADPPDLLLCTGDFIEEKYHYKPALPMVLRLVAGFRARLGCFGILGNHDKHWMWPPLEGTNITLLDGRRREVTVRNAAGSATIELIGLPGTDRRELSEEFVQSVPRRHDGTLRIVLSHFPDHLARTQYALQPDLFLAGHTHGGQVCLPGGWPIVRHDTLPRRLCSGLHWVDRTWLIVSRGFGFSGLPVRLFCPAEVLEVRLTRMV